MKTSIKTNVWESEGLPELTVKIAFFNALLQLPIIIYTLLNNRPWLLVIPGSLSILLYTIINKSHIKWRNNVEPTENTTNKK